MPIAPELRRDVHLPAEADAVWAALTDPDKVAEWFGASVEWDLQPGGRAAFRQPGGDREGRVEGVEPGRRLRWSWWPAGDRSQASEVTYELQPDDDGTRLTVTERRVAAPSEAGAPLASPAGPTASVASGVRSAALSVLSVATPAGPHLTVFAGGATPASSHLTVLAGGATPAEWTVADEALLVVWASIQAIAVG